MKINSKNSLVIKLSRKEAVILSDKFHAFNEFYNKTVHCLGRYEAEQRGKAGIDKMNRIEYKTDVCRVLDCEEFSSILEAIETFADPECYLPF